MKKTRGLSLILCIAVILSMFNFSAYAEENTITAYITISKYGEIEKDKNDNLVAEAPVTLAGKESYTLDDLFREAHDLYYDGGAEAGYISENQLWGLSISKTWGDISGNFIYQINGGTVDVMDLTQTVNNGDYVDLCILTADYEYYSHFGEYEKTVKGDKTELTLYDYNWVSHNPLEGAEITLNGKDTGIFTDENGKFTISFEKSGKYIISAKKSKTIKPATPEEREAVAITAPVCILDVTVPKELEIIHSIVKRAIDEDISENEQQIHWLLSDIAGYLKLYPDKKNIMSQDYKDKCYDKVVAIAQGKIESQNTAEESERQLANPLAKAIIALRAMGYDAENVYNNDNEKIDIVGILKDRVNKKYNDVKDIYTLPFVIIAIEDYLTEDEKKALIEYTLGREEDWLDTKWGIDGTMFMLPALAPYAEEYPDVKMAFSKAVEEVKKSQSESGAISSWGADSADSTGLAIAGLSAIGVNPKNIKKNGNSLITGLMSLAAEDLDGFLYGGSLNWMSTEQGLRGLIAWQLAQPFAEADEEEEETGGNSGAGGNNANSNNEEDVTVTVKILVHNAGECNNEYTYKNNSNKYYELVSKTVKLDKNKTVYDATIKVLDENGIDYEDNSGYIKSIDSFIEKGHGDGSGWQYMVNGVHQTSGCNSVKLTANSTILWYFTDDYTNDYGSELYTGKNGSSVKNIQYTDITENIPVTPQKRTYEPETFADVKENDWHFSAVKFVYENNLMSGTDKGFEPESKMTRAMLVSVLYRLSGAEKTESGKQFADVKDGEWYTDGILWAASVGIVNGVSNDSFAPDAEITREQMAVILYNFAKYYNQQDGNTVNEKITEFEDFAEVSDYAKAAISWANAKGFIAGESENTLNPKNSATRAQVASLLMRYCEAVNQ